MTSPMRWIFSRVQQTFTTVPNEPYQVSFLLGLNIPASPGPVQAVANLYDGTGQKLLIATINCPPFNTAVQGPQWAPCRGGFVAKSGITTLEIRGVAIKGLLTTYIGLDAVDVECVAPRGNHGSLHIDGGPATRECCRVLAGQRW